MKGQSRESKEQRKKGSAFIILVLFMCVLATVAAVILISSPTVSVQYKDIGGVVIDKQHAMIEQPLQQCSVVLQHLQLDIIRSSEMKRLIVVTDDQFFIAIQYT